MDVDNPDIDAIARKSIEHWLNIEDGKSLTGFSYTGSVSLYALLRDGDKAYKQLQHFLNKPIGISLLLPNTLYVETGGKNPTLETPLSASTGLSEMMLQSWNDIIRIFPAIPSSWNTCCFGTLRAEGGFTVSAQRKDGQTQWVKITSEQGNDCRVKIPGWLECYSLSKKCPILKLGNNVFQVKIKKGESVTLVNHTGAVETTFTFAPASSTGSNFYGVKKGHGLPRKLEWPDVPY
jgi:hypothetical protein